MSSLDIAVIGISGRFPGASCVSEFWRNLEAGVESISFFSEEELESEGLPSAMLGDPRYVKARGALHCPDFFDASFFGFTPHDAAITDPQHRLFLECAWEALEDGGHDPEQFAGSIGVYASASLSSNMMNLLANPAVLKTTGAFQILLANDKDFLATRVSYKLGLEGPSMSIQSACSSSLLAIHLACQGLLSGDCDMALAGGTSVTYPGKVGYLHEPGGILSPDGHCRAFDAQAGGTVSGDGVSVVLLKRAADAIADRNSIKALIKASAANNDGSRKLGYAAPRADTQARVISQAYRRAGIDPASIGYIEAHGTGTALGDPIEISALKTAFRDIPSNSASCAIGSVKTNIGHLDAAAGVAGFVKAVLTLQHRAIPPTLHFERLNPAIDLAGTPFFVNRTLNKWESAGPGKPRRAGVSSLGMGGTNVHVVLEETSETEISNVSRRWQLLPISAKTESAADEASTRLATYFQNNAIELPDAAYTLMAGRRSFPWRRAVVASDTDQAIQALESAGRESARAHHVSGGQRPVAFLFPGQGAQHPGMASSLYKSEEAFRIGVDQCAELLRTELEPDLRDILFRPDRADMLHTTMYAQPALFTVSYAVAKLWVSWGVCQNAMLGHSVGEYVAACLAGVFQLEDVLRIIALRARLMAALPPGAMLAVASPESELAPWLSGDISLAAVNGRASCVLSGPIPAITFVAERLKVRGIASRRLRTSHAFHSAMMDPIVPPLRDALSHLCLHPPAIPFVSSVTGCWIDSETACNADYWATHVRRPVRFGDAAQRLAAQECILLEVGPGRTLGLLLRSQVPAHCQVISSLDPAKDDELSIVRAAGDLWLAGGSLDPEGFYAGQNRRRVPLPTYPFERQRYRVEPNSQAVSKQTEPAGVAGASHAGSNGAAGYLHDRPLLDYPYVAPADDIEQRICAVWEDLLGLKPVGTHDRFLDLGGHSLLSLQLVNRLRDEFHVEIAIEDVLAGSTVADLAGRIRSEPLGDSEDVVARLLAGIKSMSKDEVAAELQALRNGRN
ncbi:MAG TPA: beta-ketoacyl synthase N-terminal-like domain-containing protein [Bryobacteraceae bacterium]|jgi:acyl transferase domain-containing protein/acyl carrier protein|nr:beta-ketoacyl synthase N-terminal-like domain-containing protein [Bryobacteraceae bacterium]